MPPKSKTTNPSSATNGVGCFTDFDFTNFWTLRCDYARDNYTEAPVTDDIIHAVEAKIGNGRKLPQSYIDLARSNDGKFNGGMPKKVRCPTGLPWPRHSVYINGIFGIGLNKNYSLGGSQGSNFWKKEWRYPSKDMIYFADCPSGGHDMLALDYSSCKKKTDEPKVVHIDQEGNYRKLVVANSFEEFIRKLEFSETFTSKGDESQTGTGGTTVVANKKGKGGTSAKSSVSTKKIAEAKKAASKKTIKKAVAAKVTKATRTTKAANNKTSAVKAARKSIKK